MPVPKSKMKAEDFVVSKRPRLAAVSNFPEIAIADYERRLKPMQDTLQLVQQAYLGTTERAVVVLEGWDTAGKGGVVRRLGWALDPRSFKVHPIAAPSSRERSSALSPAVLGKASRNRVRSWCSIAPGTAGFWSSGSNNSPPRDEWKRAYREINEFERTLVADGIRLVKIFLHITPDEQIRRFKDRLTNPRKRWKLSYEDFRNRDRWKDYEVAIEDMMEQTSAKRSRWYLVPANNKPFARLAAFSILTDRSGRRRAPGTTSA